MESKRRLLRFLPSAAIVRGLLSIAMLSSYLFVIIFHHTLCARVAVSPNAVAVEGSIAPDRDHAGPIGACESCPVCAPGLMTESAKALPVPNGAISGLAVSRLSPTTSASPDTPPPKIPA